MFALRAHRWYNKRTYEYYAQECPAPAPRHRAVKNKRRTLIYENDPADCNRRHHCFAAGGLAPAITSQELLSCVPELAEFCRIDAIQLYNLDSTNMGPEQWQGIAAAVQENYDRYDGFVITHGTDTMGYTAAALKAPSRWC